MYYDAIYLISERATLYSYRNKEKWVLIADIIKAKHLIFKQIKEKIINEIREDKTFSIKIKEYMFETPFFTEDDFSNFIQVADLIALSLNHAIREYIEKNGFPINIENLHQYSPYLNCYWQLFDRSPSGKVDGWGIKLWWYNE